MVQLELFPTYPRLAPPTPPLPAPTDWTWLEEAWATLDYPEDDPEAMPQNTLQGNIVTYIKSVLDSCTEFFGEEGAFAAADLFVQRTVRELNPEGELKPRVQMLAPDVIFVRNVVSLKKRGAFDQQKEEKRLRDTYRDETGEELSSAEVKAKILVIEVMSPSNYATKGDLWKRYDFYQTEGVQEYLVVHTKNDKLYLEFFINREGVLSKMLDFPEQVSPLANVVFTIDNNELVMTTLDGDPFLHYEDERKMKQEIQLKLVAKSVELAEKEAEIANKTLALAEKEAEIANKTLTLAEKEAEIAKERQEKERERSLRQKMESDFELERQEEMRAVEELKRKLEEAQLLTQRLQEVN